MFTAYTSGIITKSAKYIRDWSQLHHKGKVTEPIKTILVISVI